MKNAETRIENLEKQARAKEPGILRFHIGEPMPDDSGEADIVWVIGEQPKELTKRVGERMGKDGHQAQS